MFDWINWLCYLGAPLAGLGLAYLQHRLMWKYVYSHRYGDRLQRPKKKSGEG